MTSVARLYDSEIHGQYYDPSQRAVVPARYRAIVRALRACSPVPMGPAIEIGSESPLIPQYWTHELGIPESAVDLVEVSTPSVDLLASSGFRAKLADVSTDPLPFSSSSVRIVVMSEVLEHLLDPDHALDEIRRVLRPDGLLALTTPNLAGWFNRVALPLGWQPLFTETGTQWVFGRGPFFPVSRPVGHLRVLTTRALLALLGSHGLRPRRVEGLGLEPSLVPSAGLRLLDGAFARFPRMASGVLVIASPGGNSSAPPTPSAREERG